MEKNCIFVNILYILWLKKLIGFYHVIVAAETEKRMDLHKAGGGNLTPSNNKQL